MADTHKYLGQPHNTTGPPRAADNSWPLDYFGLPPGGEQMLKSQVDPYSRFPRETLHLPDVYKGHNGYLTQVMIELLTEEDLVPIRTILPLRETFNETTITWNEYNFNSAILGPVPEEGVSRLVTQQVNERQEAYVRGGLAFMIEHGFWQSDKGRFNYTMQLQQIKNATIDGLYIGVLEALLVCKTLSNYYATFVSTTIPQKCFERMLKVEVEAWAQIQKSVNGWDMLNTNAHKVLKLAGAKPDAWVVDEGTKAYVSLVRPENQYLIAGPEGRELYNSALPSSSNTRFFDQRTGCLVFETKSFESPDQVEPINPLVRPRSIGEYNYSAPFSPVTEGYRTEERSIVVYDESRDGWATLSLRDALDHCGRFGHGDDGDGGQRHFYNPGERDAEPDVDDGPTFPKDWNKEGGKDMFWDEKNSRPVGYFGDMDTDGLPEEAVRDWTQCLAQRLPEHVEEGLVELRSLVHDLENKAVLMGDGDVNATAKIYFNMVNKFYQDQSEKGLVDLCQEVKEAPGGEEKKPFKEFFNSRPDAQPWGFGNPAGIKILADARFSDRGEWGPVMVETHERAKKADAAFEALYKELERACYDNVFMRQAASPPYFSDADGKNAFFANILHRTRDPIYVTEEEPKPWEAGYLVPDENFAAIIEIMKKEGKPEITSALEAILNNDKDQNTTLLRHLVDMNWGKEGYDFLNNAKLDTEHAANVYDPLVQSAVLSCHSSEMAAVFNQKTLSCFNLFVLCVRHMIEKIKVDVVEDFVLLVSFLDSFYFKASSGQQCQVIERVLKTVLYETGSEKVELAYDVPNKSLTLDGKSAKAFLADLPSSSAGITTAPIDAKWKNTSMTSSPAINKALRETFGAPPKRYPLGRDLGTEASMFSVSANIHPSKKSRMSPGNSAQFASMFAVAAHDFMDVGAMAGDNRTILPSAAPGLAAFENDPRANRSDATKFARSERAALPPGSFGPHFVKRWDRYQGEPDQLKRCLSLALLGVPVTKRALNHFLEKDVVFPFNVLYFRPNMTYLMATGVCMKAGVGTGETLIGNSDFQLGDNVQQKIHYGHYTVRYKSVVYREQSVYHAYNYKCNGYLGGNDCEYAGGGGGSRDDGNEGSVHVVLVPYQRKAYMNPMDVTGKFWNQQTNSPESGKAEGHYPTAAFYKAHYDWRNQYQANPQEPQFYADGNRGNTVCFQGHQAVYSCATNAHTCVIENTGHWGRNVYPGCGKVRAGLQLALEQIVFKEAYGGATQANHVMMG